MTIVFTHDVMMRHATPTGHPESPARLAAVLDALAPLRLETREAPLAARAALERAHGGAHVDRIDAASRAAAARGGAVALDPDTFLSKDSAEAAFRAAGAVCAAIDAVMAGADETAFCAVRPPGHHAEPDRAMGFCLFNNIAVGALHALETHGLARVAVVDFDVHHGNGTQTIAEREPRLMFVSSHQFPFYPGTGRPSDTGVDGNVINLALQDGGDGRAFRRAFDAEAAPALEAFAPELLLVSAGFDAHADDPLAALDWDESDYAWIATRLREIAARCCSGRIVSSLEGGYDLGALGRSAAAYVAALGA